MTPSKTTIAAFADRDLRGESMKKKREEVIIEAERNVKDLQKRRFGKDGDLFKKRAELIQPIQDRVFAVIDEFGK